MKVVCALIILIGSMISTPIFAISECCQCGPSACGPAPESGDCAGCELVAHAMCNGDTGQCSAVLEGALPVGVAAAPSLGGSPFILLAAGLVGLALSLLRKRRQI